LPQLAARGAEDLQLAALGVEGDMALMHDGGGRAVVLGLVLPQDMAGGRVEGVEVIDAEAAAEEEPAVGHRRRCQRPPPGEGHLPAVPQAVLALPGHGWRHTGQAASQTRIDFHDCNLTLRATVPTLNLAGDHPSELHPNRRGQGRNITGQMWRESAYPRRPRSFQERDFAQVVKSLSRRYDDAADQFAVVCQVFQPKQVRVPADFTDLDSNWSGSDFPGRAAGLHPDRPQGGLQGWMDRKQPVQV